MFYILILGLLHLLIHEAGHVAVAYTLGTGARIERVYWIHIVPNRAPSVFVNVAIALAGPFVNLVTFLVMLSYHFPSAWIPAVICAANLVPVKHSDVYNASRFVKEAC